MNVSAAINILKHAPAQYPLQVQQGSQVHEVIALEYSHEPARAVVKIAEAAPADATPEEIAKIEAAYSRWWHDEGSEMRRQGEEDIDEFVARATRAAWMNGAYVRRYVAEFTLPVVALPEPEATIAELNGEIAPLPVPVAREPFEIEAVLAKVLPEEQVGEAQSDEVADIAAEQAAKPKRTRKPKATPATESAPATPTE